MSLNRNEILSLNDSELKELKNLVCKVLEERRIEKRMKDDSIVAQKEINKRGWSLQNCDLGEIQGCRKYCLEADINEYYDDSCLLRGVDSFWYYTLANADDFYFELDESVERGRRHDLYLYYKTMPLPDNNNNYILVISPKGNVHRYKVTPENLIEIPVRKRYEKTPEETILNKISKEEWSSKNWFFVVDELNN